MIAITGIKLGASRIGGTIRDVFVTSSERHTHAHYILIFEHRDSTDTVFYVRARERSRTVIRMSG